MKKFLSRLTSLLPSHTRYEEIRLAEPYQLGIDRVRVPFEGAPIRVRLVRENLEFQIYPELSLDPGAIRTPPRYLIFDPSRYYSEISGFIRLTEQGDSFVIGKQVRRKPVSCNFPENLDMRHISIAHDGDALIFRKLVSDTEVELSLLADQHDAEGFNTQRQEKLRTIRKIFGGPVDLLSPSDALASLRQVNEVLQQESYRALDERGQPGGVVSLPDSLVPIIVGDLHAQVNNLLTLLSQNHFMEALEAGEAALIILGDAVHSELDDDLEEMEDSLLMMDLILRLKLRFPRQLFYIRGNHDSFSSNLTKFGIAQCLIWEAVMRKYRGDVYVREMKRFYELLPYLVISDGYIACHAAPIKTRFNMDMLINIYRYPGLIKELTSNRIRRRTSPAGYSKMDVRHFRNTLKVPENTPFLVSHSPLDRERPLWLEAGGIKNHHIVFSANIPWIGVFTRMRNHIIPLSYHRENLLHILNGLK
ncbi:MAG: metallophosphoesterase [Pseudomonadota bacterium]